MNLIEKVLINLANLTWQSENLKIRIHASKALASPSKLSHYGVASNTVKESLQIAEDTANLIPAIDRLSLNNKNQFLQELENLKNHFQSLPM